VEPGLPKMVVIPRARRKSKVAVRTLRGVTARDSIQRPLSRLHRG
jgi:hypothetical protein